MRSKQDLEREIRGDRRAVLLVNLRSRRGRRFGSRARTALERGGFTLTQVHLVSDRDGMGPAIEEALAARPTLLIVGSGDGTVSRIAARLAYQDTVLGVLPFGTTNNFARNLGIPPGLAAIDTILDGKVADIDLGKAGESYFANVAGIGLSADVARSVSPALKSRLGRAAYILSGLRRLVGHRSFVANLHLDGRHVGVRTHQIVVANGAFHGGTLIDRDVTIDDRRLAAFWLGNAGRLGFLADLGLFILARGRTRTRTRIEDAAWVRVDTDHSRPVELDGEVCGMTPMEFSVAEEALKILVPQAFLDE
ncbi:MAG: YegS/Rv2252/BmrU family lipid kinase [Betaproteobacteria bacterium]|nr:YegS/Rv2252/BmrU family lipid kinase [Betaproteobacteria bacterium]